MKSEVNYLESFDRLDIRVGTIVEAIPFEAAIKPAYQIKVDFGDGVGMKWSSAQITHHYQPSDLIQRKVIAIINFPPKRIAGFRSEILILGAYDASGHVVLLDVDSGIQNGAIIG